MVRRRDWAKDVEGTDIGFIRKEGDHIYCTKDGFIFKVHSTHWPPVRLSPEVCTNPTEFYKFQVRQVHGELYNLDKVIYTKADNEVIVTCVIHGDFNTRAATLKKGKGCAKCSYDKQGRLLAGTTESFIKQAKNIHVDLYEYSLVDYINANTPVTIICKTHGEFKQIPYNHLMGKGCMLCGHERSRISKVLDKEEVINRFVSVHGNRYDYSKIVYNGDAHETLEIVCQNHGRFMQSYANHYHNKQGCPDCAKDFSPRLRSGFIRSAESKDGYASLYLINCFDDQENFYKIGITTKPLTTRFSGKEAMPYTYDVINLLIGDAEWIWDFEKLLHREYKSYKYLPEKEFGGRYECFSNICINEYVKLVNTVA